MALTKKQAERIANLINDMNVSIMLFQSSLKLQDGNSMYKYNNDNNLAIVALYDEFKIKLCTYDLAKGRLM